VSGSWSARRSKQLEWVTAQKELLRMQRGELLLMAKVPYRARQVFYLEEVTVSMNVTITTYDELERWVDAFLHPGGLNLVFMVGDPGTRKSFSFKAKSHKDRHQYIRAAKLSAFQLYKQLFKVRNKALILDDVDAVLNQPDMARLLMALCETDDQARTLSWLGTESLLKVPKGKKIVRVPQEFETSSRVCVLCNDWAILSRKCAALLDRGTVVFFEPDAAEVHRFVGRWFEDEEIYAFIGEHLADIVRHSMRYYEHAADCKRLGLDWKAALLESWRNERARGDPAEKLFERLSADTSYKSDKERIAAFEADPDGGSRRTWFNIKRRLRSKGKGRRGA
jgi:hypothetical protein